jgi:hypothetical protein
MYRVPRCTHPVGLFSAIVSPLTYAFRMKAMLFTLIRDFEFYQAISPEDIGRRNNIVGRPYIASDPGSGSRLPLLIRSCHRDV